jgi:hypothetical protein
MHVTDAFAGLRRPLGDPWQRPTATAGGCGKWISLQHMQHQIYFYNIQMKHLQYTSKTGETLQTYV